MTGGVPGLRRCAGSCAADDLLLLLLLLLRATVGNAPAATVAAPAGARTDR